MIPTRPAAHALPPPGSRPEVPAPIADYALIGDTRTAALVSSSGSIDWMCAPAFDSAPLFGRLLEGGAASSFLLGVDDVRETSRAYRPGSAVLETSWTTGTGEAVLTDGMVTDVSHALLPRLLLVRRLGCRGGEVTARIRFDPRRGLPGASPVAEPRLGGLLVRWGSLVAGLHTSPDLNLAPGEERTVRLSAGESVTAVMAVADREPFVAVPPDRAAELLERTDRWWREWSGACAYDGPVPGSVIRSLITLRLLTFAPSGAPVAAPTTSLPEWLGADKNWDYRYAWPRDASLGVRAFGAVGRHHEAHAFMRWLLHAGRLSRPRLGPVYTLLGRSPADEREVGVPGYAASRPVRIGNAAEHQHQLDVYGWVIDAAAQREGKGGGPIDGETWRMVAGFADLLAERWPEPDAGIWESRDEPRHHVLSKLMAWMGLDRALGLAADHRTRPARRGRWERARSAVLQEVRERGMDAGGSHFVADYGSTEVDGALLLLPHLGFAAPDAPELAATIKAVDDRLHAGGPLWFRYPPDRTTEGAFVACSFWMAEALARTGRRDRAASVLEDACARANDVGLFSEEIDPSTGDFLGNMPQALSHSALIEAALAVRDAGGAGEGGSATG